MWSQGIGWVLALLGVAASANLLVGRRTRSLRALKTEAELHQALPDGEGRAALREHLDAAVREYVDAKTRAQPWTARRVQTVAYHVLTTVGPIAAGTILIFNNHLKPWMGVVVLVGISLTIVSVVGDSRILRRHLRSVREEARSEA